MKENKKVEQQAEDILRAYAGELDAQYADAFDAILAEDPDYQKNIERYGKRRYVKPQKRILRYAAILLVAIFAASVVVPVPQASAWRIWWLDLITKNSDVDMKVDTEKQYDFVEYYPREIPEGFELVKDEKATTGMLIRICQDHGMGYPTESDLKNVRTLITYIKNMMLNEEELQKLEEESDIRIVGIYREYCRQMREQKLMDYDDQMLYAYNILRKDLGVLAYFQNRYPYICVDEAQDTSSLNS